MRKVLVADSSAPMRKALELAVEQHGLQVASAADGTDVIAMLSTARPDALVIEHGLPGPGAADVCAALRQQTWLQAVPVVLLLGAFDSVDWERLSAAGVDEVWTKPVDFRRVVPRLLELAARRTTADTDAYLERLSTALAERDRRPVTPPPPAPVGGDEESGRSLPTLASILGDTTAAAAAPSPEEREPRADPEPPPRHRIE